MLTVWHWTQICKSVPSNNTSEAFLHEHRREPVGHKWPPGSCLKPLILLCAGYAQATRRLLQLPASANDHGCEALQSWHSDRCCFTRSCTHETRSLQFEVCKLGRSDNHCTVRLSKALSQKASSSLEAPLHQVPQTEVKAITIRLDIHKHMQRAQEKIARICIGCWKTWKT